MPTFRVKWEIDIEADDPIKAGRKVIAILNDPASIATIFDIGGIEIDRPDQWLCTDPDNHQYCIALDETTYDFVEKRGSVWYQSVIDVELYSWDEITSAVNAFGYKYLKPHLLEGYNETQSIQLIAECLFELEV